MSSRINLRAATNGSALRLRVAIAVLVFAGMALSGLINIWLETPAESELPGVALGSEALLVVERGIAFFAAWLLVLLVAVQAYEGRLPIEVSGRGVRYADAPTTEGMARTTDLTIAEMKTELATYRAEQNDLRRLLTETATEDRI